MDKLLVIFFFFRDPPRHQGQRHQLQQQLQVCQELDKDVQVHLVQLPAPQLVRTVPEAGQLLFPLSTYSASKQGCARELDSLDALFP